LRFLGDVEAGRQAELCAALASLPPWEPFRLTVESAGLLPARRAPKVVYAGLAESPELRALKDSIDAALGACRFPGEGGAFRPHITLARVRDGADRKLCDALAASLGKAKAFSFEASSFALHSSELLPTGAVHKLEAEFFSSSSGGGIPRESSRRLS
jgi:2'-5' RNA ligase